MQPLTSSCHRHRCCAAAAATAHFQACDPNVRPTVQVIDDCDECEANNVNLQAAPFAKMAPLGLGRLKIEYREVG